MGIHKVRGLLILFLSLFIWSCDKDSKPSGPENKVQPLVCQNSAVSDFGIIGGIGLDGNSWVAKNAVYLFFHKPNCEGTNCASSCTGTLVDRNVVLTAAHCVDKATVPSQVAVVFSAEPFEEAKRGTVKPLIRRATEIVIHPDWQVKEAKSDGDLALLRIDTVAPANWTTMALSKDFIEPRNCLAILAAGYGKTTDYHADDPEPSRLRGVVLNPLSEETRLKNIESLRKRIKEANSSFTDEQIESYLSKLYKMGADQEYVYVEQSRSRGVCAGDSGGPAYMKRDSDARTFVVGVASYVQNASDTNRQCHSVGAHASVYFHRSWIRYAFQNLRNQDSLKTDLFE